MKYLWMLPLVLVGCASPQHRSTLPSAPLQISKGFDPPVSWTCEQQEVNSALVWIECTFEDNSPEKHFSAGSCIDVSYYDEIGGDLVVSSRKICSGLIAPGEEPMAYVAFRGEDRQKLDEKCGPDLSKCIMLASKYVQKL